MDIYIGGKACDSTSVWKIKELTALTDHYNK